MQAGSLIKARQRFLDEIVKSRQLVEFTPKEPEKDEIYVCEAIEKHPIPGKVKVIVEGLRCKFKKLGIEIVFSDEQWEEVQPPMEVNIEELMAETA